MWPRRLYNKNGPPTADVVAAIQRKWMQSEWPVCGNPKWDIEPTPRHVVEIIQHYIDDHALPAGFPWFFDVEEFAAGTFNWIFKVTLVDQADEQPLVPEGLPDTFLLRVCMPACPYYRTESEVAAIMLAAERGVPVPRIFYFDSSGSNPHGLECIFMEEIACNLPTTYLRRPEVPDEGWKKARMVVAEKAHALMQRIWEAPFGAYGSLYVGWDAEGKPSGERFVGPLADYENAATAAITGDFNNLPGPFDTMTELLVSKARRRQIRLTHRLGFEYGLVRRNADDAHFTVTGATSAHHPGVMASYAYAMDRAKRQLDIFTDELVPAMMDFARRSVEERGAEGDLRTALIPRMWHHDCHFSNVLVRPSDDAATATIEIAAIIDWEQIQILPACLAQGHLTIAENRPELRKTDDVVLVPTVDLFDVDEALAVETAGTDFRIGGPDWWWYAPSAKQQQRGDWRRGPQQTNGVVRVQKTAAPPHEASTSGWAVMFGYALCVLAEDVGTWSVVDEDEVKRAAARFAAKARELRERAEAEADGDGDGDVEVEQPNEKRRRTLLAKKEEQHSGSSSNLGLSSLDPSASSSSGTSVTPSDMDGSRDRLPIGRRKLSCDRLRARQPDAREPLRL